MSGDLGRSGDPAAADERARAGAPRPLEERSLRGRAILFTREEAGDVLDRRLSAAGALVRHVPLTRTAPPEDPTPLRRAAARLSDFPWIALTSARAVEALSAALIDVRGLASESDTAGPRWACVGRGTAEVLRARLGVEADVVPGEQNAGALADAILACGKPRTVLFPAAENARPDLPEKLRRAGVEVVQVCAYRTVQETPDPTSLLPPEGRDAWDAVVLASAAAVEAILRGLAPVFGDQAPAWLERSGPAVLGESAEAALRAAGVRPRLRAPRPDAGELAAAILEVLGH